MLIIFLKVIQIAFESRVERIAHDFTDAALQSRLDSKLQLLGGLFDNCLSLCDMILELTQLLVLDLSLCVHLLLTLSCPVRHYFFNRCHSLVFI